MSNNTFIQGFSKLNRKQRGEALWVDEKIRKTWEKFDHADILLQKRLSSFSENYVANYSLPMGIAPNFLIDGEIYHIPMVMEESSVVAAASKAAKFWFQMGGFKTKSISNNKEGQILFYWKGDFQALKSKEKLLEIFLRKNVKTITKRMIERGGGITQIQLVDFSHQISNGKQLKVHFNTCESMGANFINTVLEEMGKILPEFFSNPVNNLDRWETPKILMAILSNYTPKNSILMAAECRYDDLVFKDSATRGKAYAEKFAAAIEWANKDMYRAVTHNKGIMNGIDAVVLATGNDFRTVEAAAHAYASRGGKYTSLSKLVLNSQTFELQLELPLALGVVGGLTHLHPLAKANLQLLGNPDTQKIMKISASAGLANHFSAIHALISTGIQSGHMKMHLNNLLIKLKASPDEAEKAKDFFQDKAVYFHHLKTFIDELRQNH